MREYSSKDRELIFENTARERDLPNEEDTFAFMRTVKRRRRKESTPIASIRRQRERMTLPSRFAIPSETTELIR